jgi:hypothetical protein
MSVTTLDPRVLGCSRRRARKLTRAARKQPQFAIPSARFLQWLIATKTPLTPALEAAFHQATENYPSARWTNYEFKQLARAIARGVKPETIEIWSILRADADLDVNLSAVPGPNFPFPEALILPHLGDWKWPARYAVEDAWRLTPKHPQLLANPSFLALHPREQSWLLTVAENTTQIPEPLIPHIVEEITPAFIAKLDIPTAIHLLTQYPTLRPIEQSGLHIATQLEIPQIATLSSAALTRIAKARRNRQTWHDTVDALALLPQELTLAALATRPEILFELGARLHAFGQVRAKSLLKTIQTQPLFAPNPTTLVALDRLLTSHRELAQTIPAFSTWDRHFSGEKPINRYAIEDVAAQITEALPALRLRSLIEQIDQQIALSGDPHAGLLRAGLTHGRHPLRRFLHAHSNGRDPRPAHPANQNWLAARPDFPLETWLHPLRITLPVNGIGDVTLEVESNPFELLRLGTYARSCLAPGASNSANAVAALLDVNKRAIYARHSNGRFLARQIVAITDSGLLLPYAVYPENTAPALEDFFQLFVEDWALQMRLPIARGGYHPVAPLTLRDWYDDGPWHRYHLP